MWLLTVHGFFSIVQKPGEENLCVRARVSDDLDRLHGKYLPTLTETKETPGGDYRYRAWVSHDELAAGLQRIVADLSYSNFKNAVTQRDPERAHVYAEVWRALGALQPGGPYSR